MGALDGLIPNYWWTVGGSTETERHDPARQYFQNQPAFDFFPGFGLTELRDLLAAADAAGDDMVYVPREQAGTGHIGLSAWYVRVLIQEHFGAE